MSEKITSSGDEEKNVKRGVRKVETPSIETKRGPNTPVQHQDDGYGDDTPVQMRD